MVRRNYPQRIRLAKVIGAIARVGDVLRRAPERADDLRRAWPELVEAAEDAVDLVDWPWPPEP